MSAGERAIEGQDAHLMTTTPKPAVPRLSARTRIGAGGRIIIPLEMRNALRVKEGDDLLLEVDAAGLHVRSIRQAIRLAQQIVAK